jgi:hypothetical protein
MTGNLPRIRDYFSSSSLDESGDCLVHTRLWRARGVPHMKEVCHLEAKTWPCRNRDPHTEASRKGANGTRPFQANNFAPINANGTCKLERPRLYPYLTLRVPRWRKRMSNHCTHDRSPRVSRAMVCCLLFLLFISATDAELTILCTYADADG